VAAWTTPRSVTGYRVTPTEPSMAAEGFALFRGAYGRARHANPLLPALTPEHEGRLRERVERAFAWGGVAAWRGGSMAGYMVAGPSFDFRGLIAALVPEFGHAAVMGAGAALYGPLYAASADRWVREGIQLHLVGHFAADASTTAALVDLGFGAVVAERLRGLGDPVGAGAGDAGAYVEHVDPAVPWDAFAPLAAEHAAYYRQSPLFLVKDDALATARSELEEHRRAGDQLFVDRPGGEARAYLVVGRCRGTSEGRLLAETRTGQIRAAYAAPSVRRQGIGHALLRRAVAWARDEGLERAFVEHETANLEGGAFWRRHFTPFLVFSMRYVERTLGP
jgi:GNAT superfamily N-acetyltransferase